VDGSWNPGFKKAIGIDMQHQLLPRLPLFETCVELYPIRKDSSKVFRKVLVNVGCVVFAEVPAWERHLTFGRRVYPILVTSTMARCLTPKSIPGMLGS